jgi:hypothetical protein
MTFTDRCTLLALGALSVAVSMAFTIDAPRAASLLAARSDQEGLRSLVGYSRDGALTSLDINGTYLLTSATAEQLREIGRWRRAADIVGGPARLLVVCADAACRATTVAPPADVTVFAFAEWNAQRVVGGAAATDQLVVLNAGRIVKRLPRRALTSPLEEAP